MNLRIALLAVTLALAGTAVHAEEFQFTLRGGASCLGPSPTCSGPTGPFTITFDLNTLEGMASATFVPTPPEGLPTLDASVPVTNYLAIVGGHTVGFAAHGSFGFGCFGPVLPNHYECGGGASPSQGAGGFSFTDNELWIQTLTEAQFNSFKDPLASILLLNPASGCGGVSSICLMETPGANVQLLGPWTITPVPAPGPLSLFMAGLIGLALSRRR